MVLIPETTLLKRDEGGWPPRGQLTKRFDSFGSRVGSLHDIQEATKLFFPVQGKIRVAGTYEVLPRGVVPSRNGLFVVLRIVSLTCIGSCG